MQVNGEKEKAIFEAGEERYKRRKLKRQASMEEQMKLKKLQPHNTTDATAAQ